MLRLHLRTKLAVHANGLMLQIILQIESFWFLWSPSHPQSPSAAGWCQIDCRLASLEICTREANRRWSVKIAPAVEKEREIMTAAASMWSQRYQEEKRRESEIASPLVNPCSSPMTGATSFRGAGSFRNQAHQNQSFNGKGSFARGGAAVLGEASVLEFAASSPMGAGMVRDRSPERLDLASSATAVAKAAPLVGRQLTRQNTGLAGAQVFQEMQKVQRRERSKQMRTRTVNNLKSRLLVDPRTSRFLPIWDGVISLAIIFTAFVTPYEVSFLPMASSPLQVRRPCGLAKTLD